MRQRGLVLISLITLLVTAAGCAHRVDRPEPASLTKDLRSIKAAAIVEFTGKTTEKGRALIVASNPDSFRIEIKGPLGTTGALIIGNKKGLTFVRRGESTVYGPNDARIPLNMNTAELVSLLLGSRDLPAGKEASFKIKKIPGGKRITKRAKGRVLYRADMTRYQRVNGFSLPFTISIDGGGYKLLIKYVRIDINPEIEENIFKTKR